MFSISWLLLTISFTTTQTIDADNVRAKQYMSPNDCNRSEYFDTLSLSCVACVFNGQFKSNQTNLIERDYNDQTVCVCRSKLKLELIDGKLQCINRTCEDGQEFRLGECGRCETDGTDCSCPDGQTLHKFYVEDHSTNQSSITFRCSSSSYDQMSCSISHWMASKGSCKCPNSGYVEEGGSCLPKSNLLSEDSRLQYSTLSIGYKRFVSRFLYTTLRASIYNCNYLKNQSACNYLLNICILKLATENRGSNNEKSNLCLYLNHLNPKLDFQLDSYYVSEHVDSVIDDQFRSNDRINLISVRFNEDGRLDRMEQIDLNDLFLCKDERLQHRQVRFGINLHKKCKWNSNDLWHITTKFEKAKFNELYFYSTSKSKLYPVPIVFIYEDQILSRWMVRRFFLVDSNIGKDINRFGNIQGANSFVIYAKSVSLQFRISKHSNDGKMYPPIIKIEYGLIDFETMNRNQTIETEFNVTFQMNDSNFKYNLNLMISILCSFAILWSIFRTWCWTHRTGIENIDLSVIANFIFNTTSTISNILIIVCIIFILNHLIVFKFQTIIHTVLLTPIQESTIIIYLTIAFMLKLIQLFKLIISITSVDIFFLDWEKPRKVDNYGKVDEKNRDSSSQHGIMGEQNSPTNTTIWRSYFVTNEWFELSHERRIHIGSHILLLLFLLECSGWKNFIHVIPQSVASEEQSYEEIPESCLARIGLASILYVLLASIQFLFKKYLSENLGYGKLHEFIDLCSVSNISVFCLEHKRYGYYLHGQSPSGRSDVNMLEMYQQLEMEESDLCSKRGLLPNTEQQTFEMYIPPAVYDHWESIRMGFNKSKRSLPSPMMMNHIKSSSRDLDKAKMVQTYSNINRFLCSFIEHTFGEADYIVQDRTVIESLFNFEMSTIHQKGRFYNDNGHSFENILLYGIEITVSSFEMMTFLMIDLIWRDYRIASIGTYFISKMIKRIYMKMFRRNLVCKTLMDERFLI